VNRLEVGKLTCDLLVRRVAQLRLQQVFGRCAARDSVSFFPCLSFTCDRGSTWDY
jgi:hypothetical protein